MFAHSLVLNPAGRADYVYDHVGARHVDADGYQRHHHERHELAPRVGGDFDVSNVQYLFHR